MEGYEKERRGWGHWSETLTPPPRSPAPTEDVSDHEGGVKVEIPIDSRAVVANLRPRPSDVLSGCRRSRWWG
ncbi:hypothetical protein CRG98_039903 [Punica granatum]|uniref:Uncharacterized protein n=1 Tax=Punica granatum TaxID=22663 RepID=A0A2I0I7F2_PUNGR|nr:hypothetical protein CRG98_039903 [Punica granatum]